MQQANAQQKGKIGEEQQSGMQGGALSAPIAKVQIILKLTNGLEQFIEKMAPRIVAIGMNKNGKTT